MTMGLAVLLQSKPTSASCMQPVGAAIEQATSAVALLEAAVRIPPPGPEFSAPHLSQDVHQLKRQGAASNALSRLCKLLTGSGARDERLATLRDERFLHLLSCAAAPSWSRDDGEDRELDAQTGRCVARSLEALGTICAAGAVDAKSGGTHDISLEPMRESAVRLASRAEGLAGTLAFADAVASRWAARRLLGHGLDTPALDALVASLPFDMHPGLVALPPLEDAGVPLSSMGELITALDVESLGAAVPFEQAALMTADGRQVRERRHTAWLAEDGIGALAYSGKLMQPSPLGVSTTVLRLRDCLEYDLGERFDCALTNLYAAGGQAACAWHRDPEHGDNLDGAKWARPTYVVSVGETRKFAFRRYRQPGEARLSDDRHVVALFTGDVIAMHGDCNDAWEHSVLAGAGHQNAGARISIVFKRALVGRDGKRGHSLEGEGRRARARAREEALASGAHASAGGRGRGRGERARGRGRGARSARGRGRTRQRS